MANVPVFKISVTNASILSGIYLLVAVLVELVRRAWNPRWIERVSLSLAVYNVLDSHDNDITYFFSSQSPGEGATVGDCHFHPVETHF